MLTGFNTNIRYRDVVFHVQSEDSGRGHPHIITHLYHGGTILFSEKNSYAERLDESDLDAVVKSLMENQHKAVLKRLVAGDFDALIRERLGAEIFPPPAEQAEPAAEGDAAAGHEEAAATQPGAEPSADGRSFGEGIVSEKPLDEVILSYLVENARKRKRPSG